MSKSGAGAVPAPVLLVVMLEVCAMGYEYKKHHSLPGLKADDVGQELKRIEAVRGELTPPNVVDESRPEDAVFHPHFEWDDPVAAERYREHQARQIIHSVVVVPEGETDPGAPKPQAFISVQVVNEDGDQRHVYKQAELVSENPEWKEQYIRTLKSKLRSLRKDLEAFELFTSVVAAIDGLPE